MKTIKILSVVAALTVASAASSHAILISEWLTGNSGNETSQASSQIAAFRIANPTVAIPDLPALCVNQADPDGYITDGNEKEFNWTAPLDHAFVYVLTKWGRGQANFDGALHLLMAGESLVYNPGGNRAPNGLSHVTIWCGPGQKVPDTGSTLALFGLGLGVLGFVARRRKA